jgi:hypothetical protein
MPKALSQLSVLVPSLLHLATSSASPDTNFSPPLDDVQSLHESSMLPDRMWTPAAVVAVNTLNLLYVAPLALMMGVRRRGMVRNAVNEFASRSRFTFSTHTSGTLPKRSIALLESVLAHARAGPYKMPRFIWFALYAELMKLA